MKWSRDLFPTDPDPVGILGDMDFGFENIFCYFFRIPDLQIFQKSGLGQAWAWLSWDRAWALARVGQVGRPSVGPLGGPAWKGPEKDTLPVHEGIVPHYNVIAR